MSRLSGGENLCASRRSYSSAAMLATSCACAICKRQTQPATIQSANLQLNGGTDLTRKGSRFLPYRAHGGNPASARDRPAQPVLPTPCAVAMTRLARVVAHVDQALGLQKRIEHLCLRSARISAVVASSRGGLRLGRCVFLVLRLAALLPPLLLPGFRQQALPLTIVLHVTLYGTPATTFTISAKLVAIMQRRT